MGKILCDIRNPAPGIFFLLLVIRIFPDTWLQIVADMNKEP